MLSMKRDLRHDVASSDSPRLASKSLCVSGLDDRDQPGSFPLFVDLAGSKVSRRRRGGGVQCACRVHCFIFHPDALIRLSTADHSMFFLGERGGHTSR